MTAAHDWMSDSGEEYVGMDSQEDDEPDEEDFELGNVVSTEPAAVLPTFERLGRLDHLQQQAPLSTAVPGAAAHGTQPPAIPTSWPIASKGRQRQDGGLPLVLFDLNGVLMQHRFNGTSHQHDLRPGVHHLLRLLPYFRLGVYTSATRGTVQRALTKLAGNLANALQQAQRKQHAQQQHEYPSMLPCPLFHTVLCREHCVPADKALIEARGGKPWDTVKPLQRYFADLSRVLLVDDSPHKSLPAEAANMLVMPRWLGPATSEGKADSVLPALVDALLNHAQAGASDVRAAAAVVTARLAALAGPAATSALPAQPAVPAGPPPSIPGVASAAASQQQQQQQQQHGGLCPCESGAGCGAAAAPPNAALPDAQARRDPSQHQQQQNQGALQEAKEGVARGGGEATAGACQGGMTRKERRKRKAAQEGDADGAPRCGSPRQAPPRPPRLDCTSAPELLAAMRLLFLDAVKAEADSWGSRVHDLMAFVEALHPGLAGALWPRSVKPLLTAAVTEGSIQVSRDARLGRKGPWYSLTPGAQVPSAARLDAIQQLANALPALQQAALEGHQTKEQPVLQSGGEEETKQAAAAGSASGGGGQVVPQQAGQAQQGVVVLAQQRQPTEAEQQDKQQARAPSMEEAGAALQDVLLYSLARFQECGGVHPDAVRQHLSSSLREAAGLSRKQAAARGLQELVGRAEGACVKAKELVQLRVERAKQAGPKQLTWLVLGPRAHLPTPGQVEAARDMILTALTAEAAAASSGQPAGGGAAAAVAQPSGPATAAAAAAAAVAACTAAGAATLAASSSVAATARDVRRTAVHAAKIPLAQPVADPAAAAAAPLTAVGAAPGGPARPPEPSGSLLLTVFEDRAPCIRPAAAAHPSGNKLLPGHHQQLAATAAAAEPAAAPPALLTPPAGSGAPALAAAVAAAASVPVLQQPGQAGQVPHQQLLEVASVPALPLGHEAAEGQEPQFDDEGGPSKVMSARRAKKLLAVQVLAASLGLPGPGPSHNTKSKLAILKRRLKAEQRRRKAEQEPALRAAFTVQVQQQAVLAMESRYAVQQAVLSADAHHVQQAAVESLEAQVAAHGGHFLRSCGPVEASGPQLAGQQAQRRPPGDRGGEQQGQQTAQQPAEQGGQLLPQAQAARTERGEAADVPAQQAKRARLSPQGPPALATTHAAAAEGALVEPAIPAASTPLQAPQQDQLAQQGALSSLHHEVLRFAQRAAPTPQEVADVQRAVEGVAAAASALWHQARTVLFGSQATGLALPGSDLDIVILNVGPHLQRAGSGFSQAQRKQLGELLEDLLDGLLGAGLIRGRAQIIEARVPIIKCCLAVGPGLMADISLGATNGAAAVDFVRRQVVAVPPLRPLCLVVKAFLREHGLNEVFTGGLSSYSVTNMVLAHLQREGFQPVLSSPPGAPATPGGSLAETFAFLQRLAGTAPTAQQAQQAQSDLGVLLWGFFDLFGRRFGYAREAARRPWLLAVEDPQEPGKDIASGSFGVQDIKVLFSSAAELLAEVCEDAAANDEVAPAGAAAARQAQQAQQQGGAAAGVLGGVVNIEAAVGRGLEGVKARRAMEHRSAAKSAAVKQQRARQGIVVGGSSSRPLKVALGNGAGGAGKPAHTPWPKQQQQQHAAGPGGGGKRGSKRGRLVEAQWGSRDGNFKGDDSDYDDASWSLRKQKKSAKRMGGAAQHGQPQGGPAMPRSVKRKGEKRKGKGGWVADTGGGTPATGRHGKRQKRQQQ
ncbi:hypothetical protein N2152v2_001347 [Parachlorella kessleri]